MEKVKLLFSKVLEFFKKSKVKEPKQTDLEKSNDNDEFSGTDQVKKNSEKSNDEIMTSQPYIVNIENTTDKIIENVSLFFGNSQNEYAFDKKGNYVSNGLIISSGVPNVTYNHIVKNFITNKFNIGLTYIQSVTQNQVLEKFTYKHQNSNGVFHGRVITPTIDPYQQQTNIVAVKTKYTLDGDTEIILHKVHPKTIVRMYFYPSINEKSKFFDKLTK
jgi:hypothetical protein